MICEHNYMLTNTNTTKKKNKTIIKWTYKCRKCNKNKVTIMSKEYYWNEDTVDHFKFISNYSHKSEVIDAIKEFMT